MSKDIYIGLVIIHLRIESPGKMSNTYKTGCASLLTPDQVKAQYHQSEGYLATVKVPQPDGSDIRFIEIKAIKEGVWNGLYESKEVLKKAAPSILGKYIVLGHPESDTAPSWPDESLGQVIDYSFDESDGTIKVLAVLWISRIPPELLQRLESGQKVHVSVGFRMYSTETPGEWNGKQFFAVADMIYYEHIGLVSLGACKPEDGCSAELVQQSEESEADTTEDKKESQETSIESKTVNQAVGMPVEVVDPEVPPPLFKDPDELIEFTNKALAITDNDELRDEQLRTAFEFVRSIVNDHLYSILDIESLESKASAMAAIVARAAESWRNNDPLFTPPGEEQVTNVTQSKGSLAWRGDEKMTDKKMEEGAKMLYHYPVLSQTEDGSHKIEWNSTEDPKVLDEAKERYNTEFTKVLGSFNETMDDLKAKAESGEAADSVARTLLLGNLKSSLPKLNDASMDKYKAMDLNSLVGIVNDLGQNIQAVQNATGDGPGLVNQTPEDKTSTQVTQSPTPVNLQRIGDKKKMTFAEAQKRLQKELGMKI